MLQRLSVSRAVAFCLESSTCSIMDNADKKIFEHKLSKQIGKAVSEWLKENCLEDMPVIAAASVIHPSLYVDDNGEAHTGHVVLVDVHINEDDDDE